MYDASDGLSESSSDKERMLSKLKTLSDRQAKQRLADQTIYQLLKAQAERTPDAIAIAAPGRKPLTYRRLRNHIDDIVGTLNTMGVGRGDRVAIVLPNGPEMAVAFAAVASGATSAPLNPAYRANEFEYYLSDLNAKALIIRCEMESPARSIAQAHGINVIELTPSLELEAGMFTLMGDSRPGGTRSGFSQPNDQALALHTSGTTTRPKIVPLTHENLCTSANYIRAALELGESDCCLNVMPLFHIHGLIGTVLSSLISGGSVVCTPGFDAPKFFEWLEEFRPTWYTAVPTMHQAILEHAAYNDDIIARCPLRFIRSSSAALPPQVMSALERVFHAVVIESYGMTEAAHQITSNPLPPRERKHGSVGTAAGPDVAIMDEGGTLLPTGETGEIVICGGNVTRGYDGPPALDQSAFLNGWFKTGDQGFLDGDGYLHLNGRLNEVINRGGEKIGPRVVDEALLAHPAVAQAVTFAVPHATFGEDVVAAVVLRKNTTVTEMEIREFVFARLASYEVPSQVLIVDDIPKSPTGKVQRIGLAEKLAPRLKAEFVAPRNPIEGTLERIWAEILRLQQVGIYDNFFALGGDSLSATRVVSRVRAVFHLQMLLETIFKDPTVADLALVVEEILMQEVEELTEEEAQRFLAE